MEKNDIFNTNLLQLPLKAQVADEGVVQDTALAAEPTAPAMGEGLVLDMLAQDGGVLRRLSNVTPKNARSWPPGSCTVARSRCFAVMEAWARGSSWRRLQSC